MADPILPNFERVVFERLRASEEFTSYENAFRLATGLPLRFMRMDEEWCLLEHSENQSPFCEIINKCKTACSECINTNKRLLEMVEVEGPMTCGCFSGLCATAVPVRLGSTTLGFLKTGQVFRKQPRKEDFERVVSKLIEDGFDPAKRDLLHQAYFQTQTIDPKRYESMILLLETFADQLSRHADNLVIILDGSEPEAIAKARRLIHAKLDEPISLAELAAAAGLSESHFCRTFKEVTKLTVTDYTTRARIAAARKELLRPAARVSDIAFQVGFQSLSQFNRSFAKLVGCSPTKFRETELNKAKLQA
ncbi:helix-turn-helix domain-containing protein [Akkermansiaceae bacterium]|nr:helix-turn-helix domain-containing protein [Akkermansiaceae bacterium]MDB4422710.1 helix-turn-helix domain-containing protein [bacterium]MDA7934157.1 helix-turn-helix domain-containing protein [Akkermansiaceae bacterium]MDB4370348.1 helix-turn-helix domain-containing protein [Akkermansiaceae bacterium]MDB4465981.1 helix-turn-helix domain-containing protein [Akkermansiaceae bacterium]